MSRTAIFVDVQNVYYTVKQAYDCHFNYAALWSELSDQGEIFVAYAYAIDKGDKRQLKFQQILRNIGFEVKLKPFIQRADGSAKGDWDVGITLDVIEQAPFADTIVLVSGDGDFDLLLQKIQNRHSCNTIVYGVRSLTADSLIRSASCFRHIEKHLLLKSSG